MKRADAFSVLGFFLIVASATGIGPSAQAQVPSVCDVVAASPSISQELTDLLAAKGYKILPAPPESLESSEPPVFLTLTSEILPQLPNQPLGRYDVTRKIRLTSDPDNYFSRIADGQGSVVIKLRTGLFGIFLGHPVSPDQDTDFAEKLQKATAKADAAALKEFDRQLPECKPL